MAPVLHSTRIVGRPAGIGTGRAIVPPPRVPPPPRVFAGARARPAPLQRVRGGMTLGDISMSVANTATPSPGATASSYAQWLAAVKAAGGTGTALNNHTAARYPVDVISAHAGEWGAPDSWTTAGDWGYYYAPETVDREAGNSVAATPGEIAQGAAQLESQWWKGPIKAIGLTVAGGLLLNYVLHRVAD